MPIYLPKLTTVSSCPRLFAIDAHLVPLSISMSHGLPDLCLSRQLYPVHCIAYFYSTPVQPMRLVASSTYSRAPLPRQWPVTPLTKLLPSLVTRCSPSTFLLATSFSCFCLFADGKVLLCTHDACSPLLCMGLFGIVCVDGVVRLSFCGIVCPCCWAGEYVRTRCPSLNPANEVLSTFNRRCHILRE